MNFDDLSLSASTLAALQEFKQEESQRIEQFEKLSAKAQEESEEAKRQLSIDKFQEDWTLSQFWYEDETAALLGRALLEGADEETVIVIASAPSVYAAIQKFPEEEIPTKHIHLLEYDRRFKVLGGKYYHFYDCNEPDEIPDELRHNVDRLLIDPPYLKEETQANSAKAAYNLLKKDRTGKTSKGDSKFKLISSTGERMKHIIRKNYPETRMTDFYPSHAKLHNAYRCYASFEWKEWKFLPESAQGDA